MFLYIIRHGHPVYEPEEMLTEIGHRQARALAPRMVEAGITKIFSSPLRRARETAQPTADALGLPIEIEPWTSEELAWERFTKPATGSEISLGGTTWVWYTDDPGQFMRGANRDCGDGWADIDAMKVCPQAKDGYAQLVRDSDGFMARLGYRRDGNEYIIEKPNDERVAVFCHQGFGLTWLSHLLRIPPTVFWNEFDITHSGVTLLDFKNYPCGRTVPKCLFLSDMSHLFASDDCDMLYHHETQV